MNCGEIRNQLMVSEPTESNEAVAAHLGECVDCASFLRRLEMARESLADRPAEHLPDAYFAQRVSAAVAGDSEQLGWAAVRLLPIALGLTLVLTAWCWLATPGPSALLEQSPTEDLLSWALEEDGS